MFTSLKTLLKDTASFFPLTKSLKQSYNLARFKRSPKGRLKTFVSDSEVYLRGNQIDLEVFLATFKEGYHRSPFYLGEAPVIVDLGSNIGLTVVDFKKAYPGSRVVGIELDPGNFLALQDNVRNLHNVQAINAGIWVEDGEIAYEYNDAQSFKIVPTASANTRKMTSLSMETFFKNYGIEKVDYLKMDIEGAEYPVLSTNNEWLKKVKVLNIEYHPSESIKDGFEYLKSILEASGFYVLRSSEHWSSLFAFQK